MNVSVAEELIQAMSELRQLFPDWRMGQLVANLVTAAGGADGGAIWDVEDQQLLVAARRLIERNRGRRPSHAEPGVADVTQKDIRCREAHRSTTSPLLAILRVETLVDVIVEMHAEGSAATACSVAARKAS